MERSKSYLPSLVEDTHFQLLVAGKVAKVKRFYQFIVDCPEYHISTQLGNFMEQLETKENLHLVLQLEETPAIKRRDPEVSRIMIRDKKGKDIVFPLHHVEQVEMLPGVTYIKGKSYDIFADPNQ